MHYASTIPFMELSDKPRPSAARAAPVAMPRQNAAYSASSWLGLLHRPETWNVTDPDYRQDACSSSSSITVGNYYVKDEACTRVTGKKTDSEKRARFAERVEWASARWKMVMSVPSGQHFISNRFKRSFLHLWTLYVFYSWALWRLMETNGVVLYGCTCRSASSRYAGGTCSYAPRNRN